MRTILLVVHRWAGLTIVLALVITGVTGAIIPYQNQLRSLVAPEVWDVTPPHPEARLLSGVELARRAQQATGGVVSYVDLSPARDHAQSVFVSPRPGGPELGFDQLFVDPYTGAIRAKVRFADLRDGAINVAPFLVSVHYSLAAGRSGQLILGVAAVIWCVMCLVGIVLSLPHGEARGASFWQRWLPAWRIRSQRGWKAANYDMHRATGLWLWPFMLVFAWSAVGFNLGSVHGPVQKMFGAEGLYRPVANPSVSAGEAMSLEEAEAVGARLMAEQAKLGEFTIIAGEALSLNTHSRAIGYYALTSLDGPTDRGATAVWFDQTSGRLLEFRPPFGSTKADAADKMFQMLHTAQLFGLPYKIFVSLFGLAVAVMAAAGAVVWVQRARPKPTPQLETREATS